MKKIVFLSLLSSLLLGDCKTVVEDLEYNTWVLQHHIDYRHKEETLSSVKELNLLLNKYSTECTSYQEYSAKDIRTMRKQLKSIEKNISKAK